MNEKEKRIAAWFQEEAMSLHAPSQMKANIDRALTGEPERREEMRTEANMRRFGKKRIVLAVAIVAMLGSITCVAAGKLVGIVGSSNVIPDYTKYEDLGKAEAETGLVSDAVERFGNGYVFRQINIGEQYGVDAEGNPLEGTSSKDLQITYQNGEKQLLLSVSAPLGESLENTFDETKEIGGVTVGYNRVTNKFVPPDYELTAEDEEMMKNPNFNLAYGSSEVEVTVSESVSWEKDGVRYNLFGFETGMDAEEMFGMAEEMLQ